MRQGTRLQHKRRHVELHRNLDELVADWIWVTGNIPSDSSVMDLMQWAFEQTKTPSEKSVGVLQKLLGKLPVEHRETADRMVAREEWAHDIKD